MSLQYSTLHLQFTVHTGGWSRATCVVSYVLLYTKVVTLHRVSGYYHNITLWFLTAVLNHKEVRELFWYICELPCASD